MSKEFKVAITDFLTDDQLEYEREVLGDLAVIEALDAHGEDDLVGRIEDADAVIVYHAVSVGRRTIQRLSRCRLIVRGGVGFDNVDHQFARERGIPVANIPDYGTEEVADSAIGMTLALTRGFLLLNSRLRAGPNDWTYRHAEPLVRLRGQVFGIVGLGRIGSATAVRAKALGMDVVFYDPYKQDGYDKVFGVRRVESLEELCRQSYVVSLHCPLTEETCHMINAESLGWFRQSSYLVNTARGKVVDTTAIPPAIQSGKLAGAAIDVLGEEPPPDDHPLVAAWRDPNHPAHDRVLVNPHSAFYCEQGFIDMRTKAATACRRALLGQPLRNVIN